MPPPHRYHPLTDEQKGRIAQLVAQGKRSRAICTELRRSGIVLPRNTVRHFIDRFVVRGSIANAPHTGRARIYDDDVRQTAVALAVSQNAITEPAIAQELLADETLALTHAPCQQSISNWLRDGGITYKRMSRVPDARNRPDVKERRATYVRCVAMPLLSAANAVFIDESPFAASMRREYGHSPRGEAAISHVPSLHMPNVSVIAAISPVDGLLLFHTKETGEEVNYGNVVNNLDDEAMAALQTTKGVGTKDMLHFVRALVDLPAVRNGPRRLFVMDNVSFHRSASVLNALQRDGHGVNMLPQYSPFLNPIETAFATWKQYFKEMEPEGTRAVKNAIAIAARSITPAACLAWFRHSQSYYQRCLDMEDDIV